MTTGEIITYMSYLVDDLELGYFTQPQMLRFLNQSLREAQKLLCLAGNNWYVKVSTRDVVANQRDYMLPCDFLYLHRLELRTPANGITPNNYDRQVLDSITINQQDNFSTYAQPIAFYLEKNYLILTPIPQNADFTMWLWWSKMVDEVTQDSDVPDIPTEYVEYLAQKATSLCFVKDDRAMDNILPVFIETEKRLKAAAIERAQNQASRVVITRDAGAISY